MRILVHRLPSSVMTNFLQRVMRPTHTQTMGLSNCGFAIYIKKYLKENLFLMKIQIFHHAKI
jgi:hypothetical protein